MSFGKRTIRPRKDPKQDRSQATVDAILEAAAQILEKQQLEEAPSTTRIAERAGVSVGSLYQYFPNKEALISAVIRRFIRKHFSAIEQKIIEAEHLPLKDGVDVLAVSLIELQVQHTRLGKILLEWLLRVGDPSLVAEVDKEGEVALAQVLRRIAPKTRAIEPDYGGFVLYHTIRTFLSMTAYRQPERLSDPQMRVELSRMIYGYLRPDAG